MTTALPPKGAYSTPPNGHYSSPNSSPKISRESGKTPPPLKDNSAQPLIKTLKVFLDANLSQAPSEAKKINGHVEQIPSIPDILKMIVEHREDIIREESPESIEDIRCLFQSIAKLKGSPFASSLVNFQLLDALFSIAHKVGDFHQLSISNKTNKAAILTLCSLLNIYYSKQGGEKSGYLDTRDHDLLVHFTKHDT